MIIMLPNGKFSVICSKFFMWEKHCLSTRWVLKRKQKLFPNFQRASHCHLQGNVCGLTSLIMWPRGATREELQSDGWNLLGWPPWSLSCDCCSPFLVFWHCPFLSYESFVCSAMADVTWPFVVVCSLKSMSHVLGDFWQNGIFVTLFTNISLLSATDNL